MGNFNALIGKRTNPMETATGKFGIDWKTKEWATSRKHKIMDTLFQKKAGRRWTWKNLNDVTKIEIDSIATNRPDFVTDVTIINQDNTGSDHRMDMSNIKLSEEVERKTLITKRPQRVVATQIRSKKFRIPTQIEKPVQDTTRTRRHRHYERDHLRHDPTKSVKSI